jgi:hypothetical protein
MRTPICIPSWSILVRGPAGQPTEVIIDQVAIDRVLQAAGMGTASTCSECGIRLSGWEKREAFRQALDAGMLQAPVAKMLGLNGIQQKLAQEEIVTKLDDEPVDYWPTLAEEQLEAAAAGDLVYPPPMAGAR